MLARLTTLWVAIRDSLWFLPTVLTLVCAAAAVLVVRLEQQQVLVADAHHWLWGGGAEGARGVLSTIAGSLVTVTGVVFSVTIVALQLASSQFTPRILRNFTADRSNQLVLGVFIGTFTYTLLVLRTVRSATDQEDAFVPHFAVTLAVGLVLVSIGFLIFFIHHAARSIQASVILDRVTRLTVQHIERLFPETVGRPDDARIVESTAQGPGAAVPAPKSGYLQAVDASSLFELGQSRQLVIRMEAQIGDFLLPGQTMARVTPASAADEEVTAGVQRAFVTGPERTPEQDVEFGIIELSDIAVKALSPGINDPTTALRCIDRLCEVLLALGTRHPPRDRRTQEGRVHFVARHLHFERALQVALGQIAHFGADNPLIVRALLDVLDRLEELLPEFRLPALQAKRQMVLSAAGGSASPPPDAGYRVSNNAE